jgi:hypothetical protein
MAQHDIEGRRTHSGEAEVANMVREHLQTLKNKNKSKKGGGGGG